MGGECVQVCYGILITKYFLNKELAFAFAFDAATAQLGPALSSLVSPVVYLSSRSYCIPFLLGLGFMTISWLATFAMLRLDLRYSSKRMNRQTEANSKHLRQLVSFPLGFWLINLVCMSMYGCFYSFSNNANDFLNRVYGLPTVSAGQYMLCVYMPAALLTPLFGYMADRKAHRVRLLLLAQGVFLVTLTAFLLLPSLPTYGVVVLLLMAGTYQALFSSILFPCLTFVVKENQLGTALGVINACQAINMGISPLVFGALKDHTTSFRLGYFYPLLFVTLQVVASMGVTLVLRHHDSTRLGGLLEGTQPMQPISQFVVSPHIVVCSQRDLKAVPLLV